MEIYYYGCFVPSRKTWNEINEKNNLYRTAEGEEVGLVEPGIFVANKGMPTGIVLPPPQTGAMNWWAATTSSRTTASVPCGSEARSLGDPAHAQEDRP